MVNTAFRTSSLLGLINHWLPHKDEYAWVLATIYQTEGSAYRKAGAMMLFNEYGQQLGLLSGGCLEADIQRHAKQCMQSGEAATVRYDSRDEDDISCRLGLGCGGVIEVLLQPISKVNNYLDLLNVREQLIGMQSVTYAQRLPNSLNSKSAARILKRNDSIRLPKGSTLSLLGERNNRWFVSVINPAPHLLIFGGGYDTCSLVLIASMLGWHTTVCDPRPANARQEHFPSANQIIRCQPENIAQHIKLSTVDGVIVMSHNVKLDAQALLAIRNSHAKYIALLGPAHRKQKVLKIAHLSDVDFSVRIHGPAGFDIGAQTPESIALSILAECHSVLFAKAQDASITTRQFVA